MLIPAEIPPTKPDILICESTFGTASHQPRPEKEALLTSSSHLDNCLTCRLRTQNPPTRRKSANADLRPWRSPKHPPHPRRILVPKPRPTNHPHLLQFQSRAEMHGRIPNLHEHD